MARSSQIVRSASPLGVVFTFMSDFRNAPRWDPQARSAEKVTSGPIGVGTRFVMVGSVAGARLSLPYEIVIHDPPRRLVLEGETRWLRYRDDISFEPDGAGTRIVYDAELELRSAMRIGSPLLSLAFARIAREATRGLAHAIELHAGASHEPRE